VLPSESSFRSLLLKFGNAHLLFCEFGFETTFGLPLILGLDAQLLDLVASVRIPPLPSLSASFPEMPSQQATCSAPLVARSQTHAVRQYLVLYHA